LLPETAARLDDAESIDDHTARILRALVVGCHVAEVGARRALAARRPARFFGRDAWEHRRIIRLARDVRQPARLFFSGFRHRYSVDGRHGLAPLGCGSARDHRTLSETTTPNLERDAKNQLALVAVAALFEGGGLTGIIDLLKLNHSFFWRERIASARQHA
jgi:hypothetical protein